MHACETVPLGPSATRSPLECQVDLKQKNVMNNEKKVGPKVRQYLPYLRESKGGILYTVH